MYQNVLLFNQRAQEALREEWLMAAKGKRVQVEADKIYEDWSLWILPSGMVIHWRGISVVTSAVDPQGNKMPGARVAFSDGIGTLDMVDARDVRALRSALLAVAVEVDDPQAGLAVEFRKAEKE